MKTCCVIMLLAVLTVLVSARCVRADATIVWSVTPKDGASTEMTLVWRPGALANTTPEGRSVIRIDKQVFWSIEEDGKSYDEIRFDAFKDMMAQMKKQLEEMPAEARQMAEQMLGSKLDAMKPPVLSVADSGQKKTISGYTCQLYKITSTQGSTKSLIDAWINRDFTFPAGMEKDLKELQKLFANMPMAQQKKMIAYQEQVLGLGMPILIEDRTADGALESSQLLKSFKEGPVDAALFEVPKGATKNEMLEMPGAAGEPGVDERE